MMQLHDVFEGLEIGDPLTAANIQIFPLRRNAESRADYALLDDLIDEGLAEVVEVDEHGDVPNLKVRNRSDRDALLLDGTELRGAKQNRMVNLTLIIGAGQETDIPVTCVESGRWAYRDRQFRSSRRTVASKLRRSKAFDVHQSFFMQREARADQGRVWSQVDDYIQASHVSAPSRALDDVFEQRKSDLDTVVDALQAIDAHGAIVAVNGEIVALDLLDDREVFRKLWPGLLRGYAMDGVVGTDAAAKPVTAEQVRSWLAAAAGATMTPQDVPGVGLYATLRADRTAGGVAEHRDRAVHVAVFTQAE